MERSSDGPMSAGNAAEAFEREAADASVLMHKGQAAAVVLTIAWFDPATGELKVSNQIFAPPAVPHMSCILQRVQRAVHDVETKQPPCPRPEMHADQMVEVDEASKDDDEDDDQR